MAEYKTPGVNINEKNTFGTSVVEAETAIPAFIGITKKAANGDESLTGKPWKITSMTEFTTYFGGAPLADFKLGIGDDGKLAVSEPAVQFTLYYQMKMFYANGGASCYVVSVGDYSKESPITKTEVSAALAALEKEQEVTIVVVPEAVFSPDYGNILTDMLKHCGDTMKNRIAILDVQLTDAEGNAITKPVEQFRNAVGSNYMSFGAAYYPWINASVLSENDITPTTATLWDYEGEIPDLTATLGAGSPLLTFFNSTFAIIKTKQAALDANPADATLAQELATAKADLHNALMKNWSEYQAAVMKIKDKLNLLPPSASIAGIYTAVDNNRGVWKAPANVSVSYANSLSETINDNELEELNMPTNGKAVNALRAFPGEGIKVWGARTLDANSQNWRYINLRRTLIFLEESVKNAACAYVSEPNDESTWSNMKCMIENFLRSIWKRGGLAGSTPKEAFEVHVGLGDTMTAEDIQEGLLRIKMLVAVSRPAEFIEIAFQQQMQKS